MVPQKLVITRLNDKAVQVDGLQDKVSGNYINNATVQATLVDQYGNPAQNNDLSISFQNVPMAYVPGSQGSYRGIVEQTFNPPLGVGYTLQITASSPGSGPDNSADAEWEIPVEVVSRTVQ